MKRLHSFGHLIGGTFLVSATTIGVGMLALPVATGPSGFFPSIFIYLICWIFMLCTAFLVLEVALSTPPDTSFISMAERTLGPIGRNLCWLVYLFLFVTVTIAHVAGAGPILHELLGLRIPNWFFAIIYTCAIASVVYLGTRSVDRLNLVLFSCVGLSYCAFFFLAVDQVQLDLLSYMDWSLVWRGLPILFTAFSFQLIIPTLTNYLNRDARKVRLVIIFGSLIPLVVYLLWEFLILGTIPVERLVAAAQKGQNAVEPLREVVKSPSIYVVGNLYAFFALTASFVPLSLAFFDFLADGFKVKKEGSMKFLLLFAAFGVPLIIALIYPHIFLVALGYAGGISCALLFGLMPPLMAWVNRYLKSSPLEMRQLPGGKLLLIALMMFALLILTGEVVQAV
jgi:tyrosine-specific transport protein